MSASAEKSSKFLFERSTAKTDSEMIQYIVVVAKGGRSNKVSNYYNDQYKMATERLP